MNRLPHPQFQEAILATMSQPRMRWVSSLSSSALTKTPSSINDISSSNGTNSTKEPSMWDRLMRLMGTLSPPSIDPAILSTSGLESTEDDQVAGRNSKDVDANESFWPEAARILLQDKHSLCIAPEEDTNHPGLQNFDASIFRLSYETQTPIVPVIIESERNPNGLVNAGGPLNIHFLSMMVPPTNLRPKVIVVNEEAINNDNVAKKADNLVKPENIETKIQSWSNRVRASMQAKLAFIADQRRAIALVGQVIPFPTPALV